MTSLAGKRKIKWDQSESETTVGSSVSLVLVNKMESAFSHRVMVYMPEEQKWKELLLLILLQQWCPIKVRDFYQNESRPSCPHPPSSYEGRREQGRQLSSWWKSLTLIGHYSTLTIPPVPIWMFLLPPQRRLISFNPLVTLKHPHKWESFILLGVDWRKCQLYTERNGCV